METLLFNGCQTGNLLEVKTAIANGCNPNIRNEEGWMPIHYAAENGFEDILNYLLDSGADVNALNSAGFTSFQILMICEHYSPLIVSRLIQAGAQVGSPLHKAILLNDTPEINRLLSQQQFITSNDGIGNTPLHISVAVNNVTLIIPLLEAGADIDAQDMYETTPLHEACSMGQIYTVGLLLNHGANPEVADYNGRTALTFAVGNARHEVTELLLKSGVSLNVQDHFGNTALHYAYENEEFELAKLLIGRGADQSLANEDGMTPVQMTPEYGES